MTGTPFLKSLLGHPNFCELDKQLRRQTLPGNVVGVGLGKPFIMPVPMT